MLVQRTLKGSTFLREMRAVMAEASGTRSTRTERASASVERLSSRRAG